MCGPAGVLIRDPSCVPSSLRMASALAWWVNHLSLDPIDSTPFMQRAHALQGCVLESPADCTQITLLLPARQLLPAFLRPRQPVIFLGPAGLSIARHGTLFPFNLFWLR